jgi:hypothetical protein
MHPRQTGRYARHLLQNLAGPASRPTTTKKVKVKEDKPIDPSTANPSLIVKTTINQYIPYQK